ncbi:hypothetical protein ACIP68_23015 [Streptomyces griseoviridis]
MRHPESGQMAAQIGHRPARPMPLPLEVGEDGGEVHCVGLSHHLQEKSAESLAERLRRGLPGGLL